MFTLFTGRHVGGLRGPPTWRLHTMLCNFVRNISTNISALGLRTHLKLGELSSLFIVYISQFFDFVRCIVFDFIFYCVTSHTLYSYQGMVFLRHKCHLVKLRMCCHSRWPALEVIRAAIVSYINFSFLV